MIDLQERLDSLADDGVRGVELHASPVRRRRSAFVFAVALLLLVVGAGVGAFVTRDDAKTDQSVNLDGGTTAPVVPVPDVTGMETADAMRALDAVGLPTTVSYEQNGTLDDLSVIRTDPPGGALVASGTTVHLVVNSSISADAVPSDLIPGDRSGPMVMPEVRGTDVAHAMQMLDALGLRVSTLTQPDPANVGLVIAQSVAAGTEVAPFQQIALTIGR
jgi:hypothetical protein